MRYVLLSSVLLWLSVLTGATGMTQVQRPLRVVATTPELGSLVNAIGGDRVRVQTITSGREDPHFLEARPAFMVMARDADLWVRMGIDLEVGWEPVLLDGARNPRIRVGQPGHFDTGSFIPYVLEVPDATVTRAHGDVHPSGNPHFMLDPFIVRAVAQHLAQRLSRIDPQHAQTYQGNLVAFRNRLDGAMFGNALVEQMGGEALWEAQVKGTLESLLEERNLLNQAGGWWGSMRTWRGQSVITFHKSFSYLAHRFGFQVAAQLEPLPGVPPTPRHLARVMDIGQSESVRLILREPFYPNRPARTVAERIGAKVVEVNSYARDPSADGYFRWMDEVIGVFR